MYMISYNPRNVNTPTLVITHQSPLPLGGDVVQRKPMLRMGPTLWFAAARSEDYGCLVSALPGAGRIVRHPKEGEDVQQQKRTSIGWSSLALFSLREG